MDDEPLGPFDRREPSGWWLTEMAKRAREPDPLQKMMDEITAHYQEYRNRMVFVAWPE